MYHVMNRGDQREAIFGDDEDRRKFMATLGEACQKTAWQVHAYFVMSNHFHVVVETPQPNLGFGMKWLPGVYTKRYNIRHKLTYVSNLLNERAEVSTAQEVLPLCQ
jgi:REP-associated tyrosine transposase